MYDSVWVAISMHLTDISPPPLVKISCVRPWLTVLSVLFPNVIKDSSNPVDTVETLCFSPDGHVLAVSWLGGGLAVWSIFGSLLFCTLDSTFHGYINVFYLPLVTYHSRLSSL